ncbi:hypothetical protein BSR29_05360 [Boudabousia liubingyangii]|uniref:Adenylate kinase n=1 Tax=Boudabousia liubingyangii TaxID=1921764 RepID=A0A1Q5PLJ1_9ACTO|nr:hypothetical protein [Boudabousia liubingyangii]OKL47913.1 hypothetical protein BSR29_05360 [Boudabousia liubingyangii]
MDLLHFGSHADKSPPVLILGVTGAGKSTGAGDLAKILNRPYIDFDIDIRWAPTSEAKWTVREIPQQEQLADQLLSQTEWVMARYSRALSGKVLPRTDLAIIMDYAPAVTFSRLFKRSLKRLWDQQEICNGNVETLGQLFSTDSILVWWFRTVRRKRRFYRQAVDDPNFPVAIRMTHPKQFEELKLRFQQVPEKKL